MGYTHVLVDVGCGELDDRIESVGAVLKKCLESAKKLLTCRMVRSYH